MKIFDMHIHADKRKSEPEDLLAQMEKAGVYGGCVLSAPPFEYDKEEGVSFEERLNEVLKWTKDYRDRLFPVLWIHPYEENIIEKIHIAVEKGIDGFKMICCNFYVYEEQCIKVLEEIAKTGKPIIFHSGILWDGKVSSSYNRPLNWEALLRIKGLRFSMGHCSWPWIDECIAMYGKFLNALLVDDAAEMFFDITPGTPQIYREELLTKLYTIGYDVGNNILFGTDSNANGYSSNWTKGWLETDNAIMDKLGVSQKNRERLYHDNLMRFLGKSDEKVIHVSPECDDSHKWSAVNEEVETIIEKWYNTLGFPKEFDAEFKKALKTIKISDSIDISTYVDEGDGKRNLLSYLYFCEKLKKQYEDKGISEEILLDTLKDIVRWNNTWSDVKNELYLGECEWLKHHLSMKLFKLGRLQFYMAKAEHAIPSKGLKKGDNVVEIHIPSVGPLLKSECEKSIDMAREFFAKYYPEFEYKCFTCHSWLLDGTLKEILNSSSNILEFQSMFEIFESDPTNEIIRYVFGWDTTERKLSKKVAESSLAKKVKERVLGGGTFYETLGAIDK